MATRTKNKHAVTVNGREFTRVSQSRQYTHCIAVLRNIERDREHAYGWSACEQEMAEGTFQFYQEQADGSWWSKNGFTFRPEDAEKQAQSKAIVDAGLEAYVAEAKARKIERFEKEVTKGCFHWCVVAWCGSEVLASKEANTRRGIRAWKDVRVIPNGANVTLPE